MDISNLILQTVVVDDEPLAADLMEEYVRKTPFLKLAGSYSNGNEAFAALKEKPADLIFCDIQMPGLSGMDLARLLRFREGLWSHSGKFEVVCLPQQAEFVRSFLGDRVGVREIRIETVEETLQESM